MEMEFGKIVKFNGALGKLVSDDKNNFLFLPAGFGNYYYSDLKTVTNEDIEECTHEEKVEYLKQDFSWGKIVNTHTLGEYVILEYIYKEKEVLFKPYINYKDISYSYESLERAIIGVIAYKHDGANSRAAQYFFKMIEI